MFNTPSRKREVVIMRQVAMFIIRKHAPFITLASTAKAINNMDHATALHSVRQIENLIEVKDKQFFSFTEECIEEVSQKWEVKHQRDKYASTLKNYL
jgi:chromosomal replication initiator protein